MSTTVNIFSQPFPVWLLFSAILLLSCCIQLTSPGATQCIYVINADSSLADAQELDHLCLDTDVFEITAISSSNETAPNYHAYEFFSTIVPASDMDNIWLLVTGTLVFFMQTGFTMLEAGSVKVTNVQNILFKNLMDACVGTIVWYIFGYCVAYGDGTAEHANGFIGTHNVALTADDKNWVEWYFSWAFAATATTIVSGSVAERCKLIAYFLYTILLTTWVYPVIVHWIWSPYGWLSATNKNAFVPVIDFAGCSVIHMVGGFSGLIGAIMLGPRLHRFADPAHMQITRVADNKKKIIAKANAEAAAERKEAEDDDEEARPMVSDGGGGGGPVSVQERRKRKLRQMNVASSDEEGDGGGQGRLRRAFTFQLTRDSKYLRERRIQTELGNNVPFQVLGVLILWTGWYGFNCGSTGGANGSMNIASKAAVNTTLAATAGCLFCTAISRLFEGYFSLPRACNGALAGLVSVTASCAIIDMGDTIAVAVIGGFIYYCTSRFIEMLRIDDPLDAFCVHGACGVWGMLAVALFGESEGFAFAGFSDDIVASTKGYRFACQLFGIFMVLAWVVAWIGSLFVILHFAKLLRVDEAVEKAGLDLAEHGGQAVDMRLVYKVENVAHSKLTAAAFDQDIGRQSSYHREKSDGTTTSGDDTDANENTGGVYSANIELEEQKASGGGGRVGGGGSGGQDSKRPAGKQPGITKAEAEADADGNGNGNAAVNVDAGPAAVDYAD